MTTTITPGTYWHATSTELYGVFGVGTHTENDDPETNQLVVFQHEKSPEIFVMPPAEFSQLVRGKADMPAEKFPWVRRFEPEDPQPGIYRNFKKEDEYRLWGIARNPATGERFGVYQSLAKGKIWVRPVHMFLQEVNKPEYGYKGPRFIFLRPD